MARKLRIEFAGGVFHVYSRGDRREDIYIDDDDRRYWLKLLGKVCKRYNWVCHAYCLMDNHYHLIIETLEKTLSSGMRQMNGVYTQAFNYRHDLVGHLYQGRFKSILVEKESYLIELTRYVLLNPVRTERVNSPSEWPWSSYSFTAGASRAPMWMVPDWILAQFSMNLIRARELFVNFVHDGIGLPSVWKNLKEGGILGSDAFTAEIVQQYGIDHVSGETLREQKRVLGRPLEEYEVGIGDKRNASIVEIYASGGYTMEEIAAHFGVSAATVSRAVKNGMRPR